MGLRDKKQDWIEMLRELTTKQSMGVAQDIFLARNHSKEVQSPKSWVNADIWDYEFSSPDFRSILWGELVFDFDAITWDGVFQQAYRACYVLKKYHIPHYIFPTGNKGVHISVFLDAGGKQNEVDWSYIRMAAYNWIRSRAFVDDKIASKCDKWENVRNAVFNYLQTNNMANAFAQAVNEWAFVSDISKVHWGDETLGSMLRCEGGIRWRKVKKEDGIEDWQTFYKGWLFALPPKKVEITKPWDVMFPPVIKEWKLPNEILDVVREKKEEKREDIHMPKGELLPCIKRLIERVTISHENLTHFARLAIVTHCLRRGWSKEKICEIFINSPDYDANYTQYQVNHIATHRYIPAGCKKLQIMLCCPGRCDNARD